VGFAGGTGTHDGPAAGRRESGEPTANEGAAPDGRRCPRPARPVTAFGGVPPPFAGPPGFARSPTGSCRRRRVGGLRPAEADLVSAPRPAVAGFSPALPSRASVSRVTPACARVPELRSRVVRYLAFGRHRRGGDALGRFGSPSGPRPVRPRRAPRRWPPSRTVSAVADPERDVRVRPRSQWGSSTNDTDSIKSCPIYQEPVGFFRDGWVFPNPRSTMEAWDA